MKPTTTQTITPDWPPFHLTRFQERSDSVKLRGYAEKLAAIPPGDPLRIQAREIALQEIEDTALLFLMERRNRAAMDEAQAMMRASQREDQVKAVHREWASHNLGKPEGLYEFAARHLGGLLLVDESGQNMGTAAPHLFDALRNGGKAALLFNPNVCAICVKIGDAARFAKTHGLPATLCWDAEGSRCWGFDTSGKMLTGVLGDRVRFAACLPSKAHGPIYAPATDPRWIVSPDKALPADAETLPPMPKALADIVENMATASGAVFDRVLGL